MSYDALYQELMNIKENTGVDIKRDVERDMQPDSGTYPYLSSIDRNDALMYAGIIVAVTFVIRYMQVSTNLMFAVVAGVVAVYLINETKKGTKGDSNKDLLFKIETLDNLTGTKHFYLYTEPRIINFFAENVDFRKYAEDAYDKSLDECDLYLKLKYDIELGTERCSADMDVMEGLRRKVMNRFYELDFNLPNAEVIRQKLYQALGKLGVVLLELMAEAKATCKDKPFNEFYITAPVAGTDAYTEPSDAHLLYN